MVFSATLNNMSVILWPSVFMVEEQEYPEKTTDLPQITFFFGYCQTTEGEEYVVIIFQIFPQLTVTMDILFFSCYIFGSN